MSYLIYELSDDEREILNKVMGYAIDTILETTSEMKHSEQFALCCFCDAVAFILSKYCSNLEIGKTQAFRQIEMSLKMYEEEKKNVD